MLAVVVMLTTAPYFLFFCRGFKTVGPFVVMIYRMITGDLLRFVSIYLVFVMGFSQGNDTQRVTRKFHADLIFFEFHVLHDSRTPLSS